ncbi:MAG: fused MFS/spermidine synthase [Elusimicrobia bacterium]|nr:fused MFS/spermidine synthase [Elusimicrobiota bacterium]
MQRHRAVVFLASFLAFSLELWSAKLLLPRFGGSAYVWTTCVIFFQAVLLAATLTAQAAAARLSRRRWARAYLALALAPLAFFPASVPAPSSTGPLLDLLRALLVMVGAPFFLLSTTTIVVQGWRMERGPTGGRDAYDLFGASNAGALAALAGYPLAVEPGLTLNAQSRLWTVLYAAYVVLLWMCAPRGGGAAAAVAIETGEVISARRRASWLLLAAAPCAAMLATANLLTFDFAAVPLLWTAPLAVYLATFVLNFRRQAFDARRLNSALLPILGAWTLACAAAAALAVLDAGESTPVRTLRRLIDVGKFGYVTAALFVVGMIAHRSLAADRPATPRAMRGFYVAISAGGLLGSLAIGVLVPLLGRDVGVLGLDWLAAGALAAAALILRDWDALSGLARRRPRAVAAAAVAAGIVATLLLAARRAAVAESGVVFSLRNFYGVYAVADHDGVRLFFHGNTDHGSQSLDPAQARTPLSYYNVHSPLAEAFAQLGGGWRRLGVVGLGAGAIAAYGRPGRSLDYYELDPDVAMIAERWFTYLKNSRARVRIVVGDARLRLAQAHGESYDVLILDAFNSGAVPVHLLTEEALRLYLRRITPDGVILLHVSNRYLDLRPMLAASATELGLHGASKRLVQNGRMTEDRVPSCWIELSLDAAKTDALIRARGWRPLEESARGARPWTDQYASLLPVLAL